MVEINVTTGEKLEKQPVENKEQSVNANSYASVVKRFVNQQEVRIGSNSIQS